jgi:hypothetical protein
MKRNYLNLLMVWMLIPQSFLLAASGDTIGRSSRFVPRFSPNFNTTLVKDPLGGYVFGTGKNAPFKDQNGAPLGVVTGIAQGYEVNDPIRITHILSFIPVKRSANASSSSKAVFSVHAIQSGKAVEGPQQTPVSGPGAAISSVEVPYSAINTAQGVYTVAALPAPVEVDKDFAISCMYTDFISNSDSIGFLTDANGDGLGMKYNWRMVSITNLWDKWFGSATWNLNLNVALFAVTENATGLTDQPQRENPARLFPNPAQGLAHLEFFSEKQQTWSITFIDAAGRVVKNESLGLRTAGLNQLQTDLSLLAPGTYIYMLEAEDGSRIAHSFLKN